MSSILLWFKLGVLPFKRSWMLQSLMIFAFSQVMIGVWFASSVQKEIDASLKYANAAKYITVQMKDAGASVEGIRSLLSQNQADQAQNKVSLEVLDGEKVLDEMEAEEPQLIQTIRSIGNEGLSLMPKLVVIRGVVSDETVEQMKLMTDVYKVEASPVHHARLKSFYGHISKEIQIVFFLGLMLLFIQLLVFHRVQKRDLQEVSRNLLTWGYSDGAAKLPIFFALMIVTIASILISSLEWWIFETQIWRTSPFLGELSIDRRLSFPFMTFTSVVILALGMSVVLALSSKEDT